VIIFEVVRTYGDGVLSHVLGSSAAGLIYVGIGAEFLRFAMPPDSGPMM
jgi:hypothetical protein